MFAQRLSASLYRVEQLKVQSSKFKVALSLSLREIVFESQKGRMMAALRENEPVCLLPFLKSSLIEGKETLILETLDRGGLKRVWPHVFACARL